MIPYLILFLVPAWWAYAQSHGQARQGASAQGPWLLMAVLLGLMIGLRHEVGGDWFNYVGHIEQARLDPLEYVLTGKDPAYSALTSLGALWGEDYLVNSVCALVFTWGLVSFCRSLPHPWLALTAAVPYLVVVVAMGYTRQGVAIGLAMLGMSALSGGRPWAFVAWVLVAALFHKTAVVLLALVLAASNVAWWLRLIVVPALAALAVTALLVDSVDHLVKNYIEAQYDAAGAAIRIAMNALPAAIFLLYRKRFGLTGSAQSFWTAMAITALVTVPLLIVSPSSTAVDRMALYWIPIQLFVWSRLPLALSTNGLDFRILTVGVIAYSLAVLLVWLFFAVHASYWVPYKFYPLVWVLEHF